MKYLYVGDLQEACIDNEVRVMLNPGEVVELTRVPNRLVNQLQLVEEPTTPVVEVPVKEEKAPKPKKDKKAKKPKRGFF